MAIYRFRISFEDYDEVIREIDIKSNQTFKDLHFFFLTQIGYDPEKSSSFYVSNDQWIKNEELAYLPNQRKIDRGVALIENSKFSQFIDDPHQKFYYIYNFERPYEFHVELIKILDNDASKTLPSLFKAVGEAPKIAALRLGTEVELEGDDDADFIDDADIEIAGDEELDGLNTDTEGDQEEDEEDSFADEDDFTDGYDEEDKD